jgi:hypothetical protein
MHALTALVLHMCTALIMMKHQSCLDQKHMHCLTCGSTLALHRAAGLSELRKQCSSALQGCSLLYSAALAASVILVLLAVAVVAVLQLHTDNMTAVMLPIASSTVASALLLGRCSCHLHMRTTAAQGLMLLHHHFALPPHYRIAFKNGRLN